MFYAFIPLFQYSVYNAQIDVTGTANASATGSVSSSGGTGNNVVKGGGGKGGRLKVLKPRNVKKLKINASILALHAYATSSVTRGLESIFKGFSKDQRLNDWVFGKSKSRIGAMNASAEPSVKKRDIGLQLVMNAMEIEDFR